MRTLQEYRDAVEELALRKALERHETITAVADELGCTRQTIYNKMDQFGISRDLGFGTSGTFEGEGLLESLL